MKYIADYFANLDPHTSVLYASFFAFLLGAAKKVNAVIKDHAAANIEFDWGKYFRNEWLVMFSNVLVIFIAQLMVNVGIEKIGYYATVIGAATLSYFGNDLLVELLGKTRKFGRAVVNEKTNTYEGEGVKTPMPTKTEDVKNITQ